MKLISWNFKKYYSSKAQLILIEKPDIAIVPECEHPDLFSFKNDGIKPTSQVWFGAPEDDKGIRFFSYNNYKIKLTDIHNPKLKYVLTIELTRKDFTFILLAVWTQ